MLRLTTEDIVSLRNRFIAVRDQGAAFFAEANPTKIVHSWGPWENHSWEIESTVTQDEAEALRANIKTLSVAIAGAARGSPLHAEADMQELRHNTRQMLANVRFYEYHHRGVNVHHDEGVVLGVDPPSHEQVPFTDADAAPKRFHEAASEIIDLIDLLSPTDTVAGPSSDTSSYRPNTAFIMMAIDPGKPVLEDIKSGIKEVFKDFGIDAITADEIEHEGAITDRILHEIEASEFLIADLTYERPNVYYEIGYAHARNKRVILYRWEGTEVHFDVAHRNCPEYENTTALKRKLRKRLEALTNKRGPAQNP